jgi:hypothetical protein
VTDDDLPALFKRADAAAAQGQRHYLRATRATLGATVIAAGFGAFSFISHGTEWTAVVATAAFALSILVTVFLLSEKPERRWYEGRAGAESAKTLAWRFAVGGADFEIGMPGREADEELITRLRSIARGLKHVRLTGPTGGDEITEGMRDLRNADYAARKTTYRRDRIDDQRAWYGTEATKNQARALQWRLT